MSIGCAFDVDNAYSENYATSSYFSMEDLAH